MSSSRRRNPPEKPLHKEVATFVIHHLHDRSAFAPFTGTDFDAWKAYLPLVRLWARTRHPDLIGALRAVVHSAQTRHEDVMAVFKKSIPCLLDWSDEPRLWFQIGPLETPELSDIAKARITRAIERYSINLSVGPKIEPPRRVMWPCNDGPRVCPHIRSKPVYTHETSPAAKLRKCQDCKAIYRDESAIKEAR